MTGDYWLAMADLHEGTARKLGMVLHRHNGDRAAVDLAAARVVADVLLVLPLEETWYGRDFQDASALISSLANDVPPNWQELLDAFRTLGHGYKISYLIDRAGVRQRQGHAA